jgi:hypothetical protein
LCQQIPDAVGDVAGVLGDQLDRRVCVVCKVPSQERRREDNPYEPAAVTNRVELRVRQVAGGATECMRARVARHKRSRFYSGDVPEAGFVEMAQVDEHPKLGAGRDECDSALRQAGADIGR